MGLMMPGAPRKSATGRSSSAGVLGGSGITTPKPKHKGGKGKGKGKATTGVASLPSLPTTTTTATPPPELTDYSAGFRDEVIGGYADREKELREKGGAFMEESQRRARESASARVEQARQQAKERGEPFDEASAMESALKEEMGGLAEGRREAEAGIDRNMAAQAAAYTSGLGIVKSPSQSAMDQRRLSASERSDSLNYLLGSYGEETGRMAANNQAQQSWMSMLSSMLNSYA